MGLNQIHNIMNVREFCLSFYALWKFKFASGSKLPYVTHSTKETLIPKNKCFKDLSLHQIFEFLNLFLLKEVVFLISNTFFGDRFSFVACLISIRYFDLNVQAVLSLSFLGLKCLIAAEFPFIEAYFPIS